jgi:hypothetical protein
MLAVAGDAGVMVRKDSPMKAAWSYLLGFTAIVLVASPADAQLMGNAPYQPRAGNIGGSITGIGSGMSPAYRQTILNAKLLGPQSNPLVRDQSGFLLTVARSNSQAFLRFPNQPFLVPTDGGGGLSVDGVSVGGGFGDGLGWGGSDAYRAPVYLGSGAYGGNALFWIGMLNEPSNSLPWSGVTAGATAAAPMNVWIAQLGSP